MFNSDFKQWKIPSGKLQEKRGVERKQETWQTKDRITKIILINLTRRVQQGAPPSHGHKQEDLLIHHNEIFFVLSVNETENPRLCCRCEAKFLFFVVQNRKFPNVKIS